MAPREEAYERHLDYDKIKAGEAVPVSQERYDSYVRMKNQTYTEAPEEPEDARYVPNATARVVYLRREMQNAVVHLDRVAARMFGESTADELDQATNKPTGELEVLHMEISWLENTIVQMQRIINRFDSL